PCSPVGRSPRWGVPCASPRRFVRHVAIPHARRVRRCRSSLGFVIELSPRTLPMKYETSNLFPKLGTIKGSKCDSFAVAGQLPARSGVTLRVQTGRTVRAVDVARVGP